MARPLDPNKKGTQLSLIEYLYKSSPWIPRPDSL